MRLISYQDARTQPELADVLQRWIKDGFQALPRRAAELSDHPMQTVGLFIAAAAFLVQRIFRGRKTDNAARYFYRSSLDMS
eukprot:3737029-Pleurochrysis_carterae.AAC.2